MFAKNNKISSRQLGRMLVLNMFSLSMIILPSIAVRSANKDGIISIIIGTILAFIYGYIIMGFSKRVDGDFIKFSTKTIGRITTYLFTLLYLFKFFLSCIFAMGLFAQIISETLLVDTNYKIILILFLLVASYASIKGIEVQGRIAEILYYVILTPTIILLLIGITKVDTSNVLPLLTNDVSSIFIGSYLVLITYSIIDIIMFTLPMINEDKGIEKEIKKSIITVSGLNIIIFIITVGILGEYATKQNIWSTVTTMQMIQLPGSFLQRQDGIMLGLWIVTAFTIISTFLFCLSILSHQVVKVVEYRYFIIPLAVLLYFFTSKVIDLEGVLNIYGKYMIYIGLPQSIIIPGIIILADKLKRRRTKQLNH